MTPDLRRFLLAIAGVLLVAGIVFGFVVNVRVSNGQDSVSCGAPFRRSGEAAATDSASSVGSVAGLTTPGESLTTLCATALGSHKAAAFILGGLGVVALLVGIAPRGRQA